MPHLTTEQPPARVRSLSLAMLALSLCAPPAPANAQALEAITLRIDNDFLGVRGRVHAPDFDYTFGVEVAADFRGLPRRLAAAARMEPHQGRLLVRAGQKLFTPRWNEPEPVPGERPYAAWLYAAADLVLPQAAGSERTLSLEVGVTGPGAFGEPVQNGIHELFGMEKQEGWDHQLATEPAFAMRYRVAWPTTRAGLHVQPHAEAAAGTLLTGAAAGLMVRTGAPRNRSGWYAEAGVRQELIARNLHLDGNTFRRSSRAEKIPWVSEGAASAGYQGTRWALEYRYVLRSREYAAQPAPHAYGSLAATWRP
jgi:lipid A 3-O-deacylase